MYLQLINMVPIYTGLHKFLYYIYTYLGIPFRFMERVVRFDHINQPFQCYTQQGSGSP